jgi:hypothetical protein
MPVARADVTVIVAIYCSPKSLLQKLASMRRSFCRLDAWSFKSKVTSP